MPFTDDDAGEEESEDVHSFEIAASQVEVR
jgi:hypothetical protein